MDIFDLDYCLVEDYQRFARSFTTIRARDIREQVDRIYSTGRFWPEPIVSINPHFQVGDSLSKLVAEGTLDERTERVFRIDGAPLTLFRHQAQATAKAKQRQSFVVTTGTGSGKSLCFFIPIIDSAIRARAAGENARTRAIVVYPMNALANSQMNELEKFIDQADLPAALRPTFARYTGQEDQDERDLVRHKKPEILLTNFMMLELLMTRQSERDRQVIANAEGLDFIVLDELHTYRGRQGADVAMLIRRLRDRLCKERKPVCIGTSATMASEGARIPIDPYRLPAAAWAADSSLPAYTVTQFAAIVHRLSGPTPISQVRLASLLALEPQLLTRHLQGRERQIWLSLVGKAAQPPSANKIVVFASKINAAWGKAVTQLRGMGEIHEDLNAETWTEGSATSQYQIPAWADGRADFVLRAIPRISFNVLTADLSSEDRAWVNVANVA